MSGSFVPRAGRSCFSRPLPDDGTLIESYRRLVLPRVSSREGWSSPFDRVPPLACLDRAPPADESQRPRPSDLEAHASGLVVGQHLAHQRGHVHNLEVRRGGQRTFRRWSLTLSSRSQNARPLSEVPKCLAAELPLLLAEGRPLVTTLARVGAKLSSRVLAQRVVELCRVLSVSGLVEGKVGGPDVRGPSSREVQWRGPLFLLPLGAGG